MYFRELLAQPVGWQAPATQNVKAMLAAQIYSISSCLSARSLSAGLVSLLRLTAREVVEGILQIFKNLNLTDDRGTIVVS